LSQQQWTKHQQLELHRSQDFSVQLTINRIQWSTLVRNNKGEWWKRIENTPKQDLNQADIKCIQKEVRVATGKNTSLACINLEEKNTRSTR